MLATYIPPRSEISGPERKVIPPGVPYLTKVNGKLVMARDKRKSHAPKTMDLIGEAFGIHPVRKRATSVSEAPKRLVIGGVSYVPGPPPPHTAPIPQQPFPPYSYVPAQFQQTSVPQPETTLPYYQYQQPLTYSAPPNVPNLTPQGIERLQAINGHFHQHVAPTLGKQVSNLSEESAQTGISSKTTISITKHICANCGRMRSRKYHRDHPISPGKEPTPDFCGRCQRDVSCTESSDSETESKKKKQKKKEKKKSKSKHRRRERSKRDHRIYTLSSSDDEPPHAPRQDRWSDYRKNTSRHASKDDVTTTTKVYEEVSERGYRYKPRRRSRYPSDDDHVNIIEEFSDEGSKRGRQGKPTRRSRFERFDSDNAGPSHVRSFVRLKPTSASKDTQNFEDTRAGIGREETSSSRPAFRYVSAPARSSWRRPSTPSEELWTAPSDEWRNKWHIPGWKSAEEVWLGTSYNTNREIPIRFSHEDDNRPETFAKQCYESDQETSGERLFDGDGGYNEEWGGTSPWGTPQSQKHEQSLARYADRQTSFDTTNEGSTRSDASRQRRRRERRSPSESRAPLDTRHELQQKKDHQVIVGTVKYVSRPKGQTEEERLQEYTDRAILGEPRQRGRFEATDDAARYYQDDWGRVRSASRETYRHSVPRRGYRRDSFVDASLADSDVTYEADAAYLPKVPTPPNPARKPRYRENQRVQDDGRSTYALDPDSGLTGRFENVDLERSNDASSSQWSENQAGQRNPSSVGVDRRDRNNSRADNSRNASEDSIHHTQGKQRFYETMPEESGYSTYQHKDDPYIHDMSRGRRTYVRDSLDVEKARHPSPERYAWRTQGGEFEDKHVTFRESVSTKSPDREWTASDFSRHKYENGTSSDNLQGRWEGPDASHNWGWNDTPGTSMSAH